MTAASGQKDLTLSEASRIISQKSIVPKPAAQDEVQEVNDAVADDELVDQPYADPP